MFTLCGVMRVRLSKVVQGLLSRLLRVLVDCTAPQKDTLIVVSVGERLDLFLRLALRDSMVRVL